MGLIKSIAGIAVPQFAVPLRMLSWARGAGQWFILHPMTGVAVLAALFGAVEQREANKWAELANRRAAALGAMQAAAVTATRQATAAKEAKDAYNAQIAAQSDSAAADLRARYHAAVMQLTAARDRARNADLPGDAGRTQGGDRSGSGAGVSGIGTGESDDTDSLAITRADALTCADNTARLQAVHDWAIALNGIRPDR